ncbi:TSL-kinase interacting protein 1 isoform X1 [Hevea brasiliensis]|uniref:TSL-kinase interacting protein 1 isoform X1 n=1 Tax=Hevea brasiliensis TaxID=3981 RepID=UPI0025DC281C|nr:TSL-kinase interacting protein 1 isoform X1 [Hevea brasiliensis]XP_058003470.1 TSL-kinase interacting protein 1 isoform X1 [Hevea brasiliensis]XP_058003471.1 TSL-kinase interacting protein 1 isoform X1 [Hevea brasiliensis]XP_058003472.1 TSL-kinase interacting protein 1 isoform X1 [Hevea brasiliensis]
MEMESQVSLDSTVHSHNENTSIQHGDTGITSSIPDHVKPQQPAKKPTRQWAAWTREEEESFFTALRQVGKNFEKITRRVQSKNKDQVRHYYYRLVRRMNKLLGPGLCLDAKNSKDTNAAMLRWWSLLEKYSCKASKLHLKPRRFKIFIEALENQLLKDRKKNVRKRPSQVENVSPPVPSTVTSQNRASTLETRTVKLVLVDSQNLQRLGAGKGSLKRNVNIGVIRGNRGDSTAMKPARQRRKQVGVVLSAAYKKWEKAAIAGVSLVADAAEHLERTATDKEIEHDHQLKSPDAIEKGLLPLSAFSQNYYVNAQTNMKLKLQLFPIDDGTRRALETDKHNPHLELTLSTRKKISSVLEHLNRKWGNSSIASGELMLFPYSALRENLVGNQRWTQDSIVSALDVYTSIGSPPVFRLRYGWFSNIELASVRLQAPSASSSIPGGNSIDMENEKRKTVDSITTSGLSTNDRSEKNMDLCKDQLSTGIKSHDYALSSTDVPNDLSGFATGPRNNFDGSSDPAAKVSWHEKETGDRTNMKHSDAAGHLRLCNGTALSAGEWADSLTNISVGDLLSEVPHDVDPNCIELPIAQSSQCLQQIPFSCDSFDAAIAAHMSRHQNKIVSPSTVASHIFSIWDAEETCDAFSFQKNHALHQEIPTSIDAVSPGAGKQMNSMVSGAFVEGLPSGEGPVDYPAETEPVDDCSPDPLVVDNLTKDFTGLTDIYWPESLGPLDLDIPSSKYHSEEFILNDSLSGLNRLIASSLDAFQNCSFFGLDEKDSMPVVEARETSSFSDFKIGSGV